MVRELVAPTRAVKAKPLFARVSPFSHFPTALVQVHAQVGHEVDYEGR